MHDFDPEEFGMEPEVLFKILDSRPLRLLVRKKLLKGPREIVGTQYWLSIQDSSATDVGAKYDIKFNLE